MLPTNIRTKIESKIGGKIVSFDIMGTGPGGGSRITTFPEDFTGIGGPPSTETAGDYGVIFAFLSYEETEGDDVRCCSFLKLILTVSNGMYMSYLKFLAEQ